MVAKSEDHVRNSPAYAERLAYYQETPLVIDPQDAMQRLSAFVQRKEQLSWESSVEEAEGLRAEGEEVTPEELYRPYWASETGQRLIATIGERMSSEFTPEGIYPSTLSHWLGNVLQELNVEQQGMVKDVFHSMTLFCGIANEIAGVSREAPIYNVVDRQVIDDMIMMTYVQEINPLTSQSYRDQ